VTFQIGLFSDAGMVIAGDTKSTEYMRQYGSTNQTRYSAVTSKFIHNDDLSTVIAISGDNRCNAVARNLLERWGKLGSDDIRHFLQIPFKNDTLDSGSLIVVRPDEHKMYRFTLGPNVGFTPHIEGKVIQGDCATLAVLFAEHYVELKALSLDALKKIAAFTVWLSERLNPTYVSGLEMIEFPQGGKPRVLTPDELAGLQNCASDLDAKVRAIFESQATK
jgi:hypothetical protein